MNFVFAAIKETFAPYSVDSIVADFNTKLAQLDKLIETKSFLAKSYAERIEELVVARSVAQDEIVRATKVHNKISNLINNAE